MKKKSLYIAKESSALTAPITERHLEALWYEQNCLTDLKTAEATPLTIVSKGEWNAEEGPAFKNAEIAIDKAHYFGDVALFLSDDEWEEKRLNPLYANVILILFFWLPERPKVVNEAFTCYLEPHLTLSQETLVKTIDLDLYPYKKASGSGRCAKQFFPSLTQGDREEFFKQAALSRLQKKQEQLSTTFRADEKLLVASMAKALGAPGNSRQFLRLYMLLDEIKEGKSYKDLLALALGFCGFFEDPYLTKWKASSEYLQLLSLWKQSDCRVDSRCQLSQKPVRPNAHPLRRIVLLVKLIQDPMREQLLPQLLNLWKTGWQENPLRLREALMGLLPNYKDAHFNTHYTFEEKEQPKFLTLLGDSSKQVVVINSFLPMLYEVVRKSGCEEEEEAFQALYSSFKEEKTKKGRYLAMRFLGSSAFHKEQMTQGAYEIHEEFCIHYDSCCSGCPFIKQHAHLIFFHETNRLKQCDHPPRIGSAKTKRER